MSNPYAIYKANYINNLPSGVTYNSDIARFFYNGKRFVSPHAVEFYRVYLSKFSEGPSGPAGSGGVETVVDAGGGVYYRVHTFLSGNAPESFVANREIVSYGIEVVAGGGSGGSRRNQPGGGGGAGGAIQHAALSGLSSGTYAITVGAGGQGTSAAFTTPELGIGESGGDSTALGYTADGGGRGGGGRDNYTAADGWFGGDTPTEGSRDGNNGGCGGGRALAGTNNHLNVGSQGGDGGICPNFNGATGGGGMGGDGAYLPGANGDGGDGGAGISSIIPGVTQQICEGGGGGTSGSSTTNGVSATGVGGDGSITKDADTNSTNGAQDAQPNTGSGGGGNKCGANGNSRGGHGSDGYVAIWYEITEAEYLA